MSKRIGIRHEDKYRMERRTPIVPSLVRKLVEKEKIGVSVQTSPKRVFTDLEYHEAGAQVKDNLNDCGVIFGVKEIPEEAFEKGKTYVFFSHVIKGQPYNMPMLKRMMEMDCNLIDYERIVDEQDKRLIFFGRFAGLAGMIDSLWSMGQRLREYGQDENPFLPIRQSCEYASLEEAKREISAVGKRIAEKGLPNELLPLTIGFTGYGNVSAGAQEIAHLLPLREISPEQLLTLKGSKNQPANIIYKVVFREEHLSRPIAPDAEFELQDYYGHPEKYESDFEKYIPHLSILMNCMYWDTRYPRIVTKEYVRELFRKGRPRLTVIGDVTCDPDGSVEITHKGTPIEDPVFVYNPETGKPSSGFSGHGLLVMAVDILPSELPRDSSMAFSNALSAFVKPIAEADFSQDLKSLDLPNPLKKALILHKGKLTPDYEYIRQYL
jgi:alanine dehydrogenase